MPLYVASGQVVPKVFDLLHTHSYSSLLESRWVRVEWHLL